MKLQVKVKPNSVTAKSSEVTLLMTLKMIALSTD